VKENYRRLLPYGVALGTTAIALLLTFLLAPFLTQFIGVFFFGAITVTTWYGGLRPGFVAIALSTLAVNHFFVPPEGQTTDFTISDIIRFATFSLAGVVIHTLSSSLRASQRQVQQLSQHLLDESADRLKVALNEAQTNQTLLQQQFEQQRLVMEITQRIRQSLNLEDILQTTVDEVRQLLQTDRVVIFRFFPDWRGIVAVESCGADWTRTLSTAINDPCFGENYVEPFKQGLVTAKADIYTAGISECHLELLSRFQVRANLVVPIMKNTELWGLLIAHHCTAPRPWQDSEINLLRQIASQVGIALQQSALFEQVQAELIERRQVEVALQESQVQLQQQLAEIETIYQSAPIGLNVLDTDLRFVRINQHLAEMNGLPIEAHIGHTVRELLPDLADTAESLLYRVLETGKPLLNIEITGETPAQPGVQRTWIESFLPLKDSDTSGSGEQSQRIIGISTVCEEITDRKRMEAERNLAEAALQENQALLQAVLDNTTTVIYIKDLEGKYLLVNHQFERLTSYACSDITGKTDFDLFPEATAQHFWHNDRQVLQSQTPVSFEEEVPLDGGIAIYSATKFPLYRANGELFALCGMSIDITKRKQAEEALRQTKEELEIRVAERTDELQKAYNLLQQELSHRTQVEQQLRQSEARYRAIVEDQTELIARFSPDSTILFVNDAYCHYFNIRREDILGKSYNPIIYEADQAAVSQLVQTMTFENPMVVIENRVIDGRGEVRWTQWINRLLYDAQENLIEVQSVGRDITALKQTEQALRDSEERRRLALDLTHLGFWDMDLPSGKVIWNDNHFTLLGLEPYSVEPSYELWCDCIYPDDRLWAEQQFQQSLETHTDYEAEYRVVHSDHSIHWVMARGKAIYDDTGKPMRSLGVVLDVSDRKQAEAALQQQTRLEQLRWAITQSIRQSLDLNSILDTAVEQLRQTLQVDRVVVYQFNSDWSGDFVAESVSLGWGKLIHSDSQTIWSDTCLQKTHGGRFQHHEALVIPDIDTAGLQPCHIEVLERLQVKACTVVSIFSGKTLWGLLAVYQNTAVRNWQSWEVELLQQIASQLAIAIQQSELYRQLQLELQERQQTEAVLREAERRWQSLLDNVQLVVVGLDIDGNVEYVNPFFLELSGYPLEEVLGKSWFNHFLSSSQRSTTNLVFREVLEHNFHPHYQNPILTKWGEERMIAWSNTVLQDTAGKTIGTISIGEDITERYKIDRMKAEFISVVSHELRTPLTSMQAALSLLNEKIIDPISEEGEVTIQIATEGTDRLVRLVNDILDLERLESGKVRLEKHLYSIDDLVTTAVAQMQEMANQAKITLEASLCHVQVTVDGDRLVQILTNLLSNAIKFSSQNSVVRLSVEQQELENNPSFLLFAVCDQGRGIPTDKLESIFDRFHQVDASDSRAKGGTGLGLAICRSIVQQHGGEIWVESIVGQGSTFYFTIPMRTEGD
jgi:PAS domain S-box-containing protein